MLKVETESLERRSRMEFRSPCPRSPEDDGAGGNETLDGSGDVDIFLIRRTWAGRERVCCRSSSGCVGAPTVHADAQRRVSPQLTACSVQEKVDVFSYAMVVYEIICREVPFEEEEI